MRKRRIPRTHPTTKPMVSVNRRDLGSVEVRLGVIQLVIMLGVVTGCMACAFFLGFNSGKDTGFERAMDESLANTARLPISADELDEGIPDELVSKVYAKLSDKQSPSGKKRKGQSEKKQDREMPQIGSIETTDVAPVVVVGEENLNEGFRSPEQVKDSEESQTPGIRVLGSESKRGNEVKELAFTGLNKEAGAKEKSLGELLEDKKAIEKSKAELERNKQEELRRAKELEQAREKSKVNDTLAALKMKEDRSVSPQFISGDMKEDSKVSAIAGNAGLIERSESKAAQPAKVVQQKSVESPPKMTAKVPSGWYAQVAAPKDAKDAKGLADRLRASGFSPVIEVARVRGEQYYRVLVGPEGSRKHSERLLSQLKRESFLKGDPFIKLVR